MKFISVLKTVSISIAILLVLLATFLSFVDGVAIIFSYISLLFALLAYSRKNVRRLKVYGFLFILSHGPFVTMAFYSASNLSNGASEVPSFSLFEKCSNEMFSSKEDLNKKLTEEERETFKMCLEMKIK